MNNEKMIRLVFDLFPVLSIIAYQERAHGRKLAKHYLFNYQSTILIPCLIMSYVISGCSKAFFAFSILKRQKFDIDASLLFGWLSF